MTISDIVWPDPDLLWWPSVSNFGWRPMTSLLLPVSIPSSSCTPVNFSRVLPFECSESITNLLSPLLFYRKCYWGPKGQTHRRRPLCVYLNPVPLNHSSNIYSTLTLRTPWRSSSTSIRLDWRLQTYLFSSRSHQFPRDPDLLQWSHSHTLPPPHPTPTSTLLCQ